MFEAFALFTLVAVGLVAAVVAGTFMIAAVAMKFALKVVLLPFKLLLLPLLAIGFILKAGVVVVVGAIVFAMIVPLLIAGLLIAIPFALVAALS